MPEPIYWKKAQKYLSIKDKKLSKIISQYKGHLKTRNNPFYSLCKAIVGQQISVQSADSVWKRFSNKCKRISPKNVESLTVQEIRDCGITRQKTEYIKLLSANFVNKNFKASELKNLNDEEAISYLCKNKGIGKWTAEMFLIFNQNRQNLFPIQDIGLLKGISQAYETPYPPSQKDLDKFRKKWSPFCTVATWYMWRSVDPVVVEY
jgi:DNA-3-methyladenine glycosylase II